MESYEPRPPERNPHRLQSLKGYCQTKITWDGAGGFISSPYDKTLPIQVL